MEKLQKKLDSLERSQLIMKEGNAYYCKLSERPDTL